MKKLLYLLLTCVLCSALVFTACSKDSKEQPDEAAEATEAAVTQEQIEKSIIGTWIKSEVDGQPALTNEKTVFDIVSTTEAYESASRTDGATPFAYNDEADIDINGNVVTITLTNPNPDVKSVVHEFAITGISDSEFTANRKFTRTIEGADPYINEEVVTYTKVNDNYSYDIIGKWEGRCTSEGSVFDDGQDHRWEFKDDGTYIYYVKKGDDWVPADAAEGDYFVAGNLLCGRWFEGKTENREWWDIAIDGDTMNWTALRENEEDGSTFTASFEMKKVEE